MKERIIQAIQEAKESLWEKYEKDDLGYDGWFDHLPDMKPNDVDDIIRCISKWDFDDTDDAVFYYTKITTLESVLYDMEEE